MQQLKKPLFKINKNFIEKLDPENFDGVNWKIAVDYFKDRFNKRYFNQLHILIHNKDSAIRNNCGFLVTTLDCVLIETLEQFYTGHNETKNIDTAFLNFFKRNTKLNNLLENRKDVGIFLGFIRSGLVHQAMTKKQSIINIKKKDLFIKWIDNTDKKLGFEINRNNFHSCVIEEYNLYAESILNGNDVELLKNFKNKLLYIII